MKVKKLKINVETLKVLTEASLQQVKGAGVPWPTATCICVGGAV